MDITKYKSLALSMDCYKKLKEMASSKFEMPLSLAKTNAYFINQAYKKYKNGGNNKHP